jgi:sterol desaturase/sphingolipid hydroxylase (fatty acid hydroxylase superfamily)
VQFFNDIIIGVTSFDLQGANPLRNFPMWAILIIGFLLRDFVQWWIHRLLHKVDFLWQFHKVHHSVEEMGFAAHLRYHWMENIVYRTIEYLPLALIGIGLYDFFIIHIFTLAVGHYNHSNIHINGRITGGVLGFLIGVVAATGSFDVNLFSPDGFGEMVLIIAGSSLLFAVILGPFMKLIFNSPEMHIWHHSYELPKERQSGINFGITLALWDFIFNTAHIPYNGRDIKLGFPEMESFPHDFAHQQMYGVLKKD